MALSLIFASKADCDYFVSLQADHWWYMRGMYNAKRVSALEIEVDESFLPKFLNPLNKEPLQKGLKENIQLRVNSNNE